MPINKNKKEDNFEYTDFSKIEEQFSELLGMEKTFIKARDALIKKSRIQNDIQRLKSEKLSAAERIKLEQSIQKRINKAEKQAVKLTQQMWARNYSKLTDIQKAEALKVRQQAQKDAVIKTQLELDALEIIAETGSKRDKEKAAQKRKELEELKNEELSTANELNNQNKKIEAQKKAESVKTFNSELKSAKKMGLSLSKINRDVSKQKIKELNKQANTEYKNAKSNQAKIQAELKTLRKEGASSEEIAAKEAELTAAKEATAQAGQNQNAVALTAAINELSDTISSGYDQAYKAAEKIVTENQSIINARLQGSDKNFQEMMDLVTDNLSFSPLVKMEDVINSIKEASDQGIVYNIEQRAFLDTVSEKIAKTFDAFDSNLLRLIRLQQADTTAARLGMEASLTKLFNSTFNDSSYLTDVYDAVSAAIIDANSQLTKQESAAFEYTLQKWLGSLYSLGLSSNTVTQIAEGINYLATGDVTNLASNSSLQTLMAMSASNAGLDFAEIMLEGLDAETTNRLMESMVLYLKDIAENSDSQVIKSAYGDIFKMSLSDLRAFSNMTTADISSISSINASESSLLAETSLQLAQIITRSSLAENLSNIYNNALFGIGMDMASNPATWTMDKVLKFMESNNIDMNIPFISVAGFGLDLNASVVDLLNTALGFSKAFSLIGNIIGSIGSSGGLNLAAWGGTEYNQRGNSIGGLLSTMIGGTSSSTYVANNSSSDTIDSTLYSATDEASETSKITNKNTQPDEHSLDDFWEATVGEGATDYFVVQDAILQAVYYPTLQSIRVADIPLLNYMAGVFGNSSLLENESIRTKDIGISEVRNGNYLRVKDDALGSSVSSGALQTYVRGGSLTAEISNLTQLGNMLKQNSNNTVTLSPNTQVTIDEQTLVKAIVTALSGTDNNIKLKQFIDGSLSIDTSYAPTFKIKVDSNTTNSGLLSYNGLSRY